MKINCNDYEVSLPARTSPEILFTYEHSDAPLSTGVRPRGAYLRVSDIEPGKLDLVVECGDAEIRFTGLEEQVVEAIEKKAPLVVCSMDNTNPVFVKRVQWTEAPRPPLERSSPSP